MKYAPVRGLGRFVFCLGVLALASCGTSEYERRMNSVGMTAAKQGAARASFDTLLFGRTPGVTPSIRIPQMLAFPYKAVSTDDQFGGKPITPAELQPPGMQLPGFQETWRGYKPSSQGPNWPIYLYLCQQRVGAGQPLADAVMAQLNTNKAFTAKPTPWTEISFMGEDGVTPVPWRKTEVKAEMEFTVPPTETPLEKSPSTLQFYAHTSNEWEVVVGFRIPDEMDDDLKYTSEIVALVCGSVQTAAQPATP